MTLTFETRIEQYPFDKDGITLLKNNSEHGEDWPVVYILNGKRKHMLVKHKAPMIE